MNPWRLELLRVWRTRRLVALAAIFLILGLGIPVLTAHLPELAKNAGRGVRIIAPKPKPADAIAGFAGNAAQLGTLVVVVVAAACLSLDARPALAAFYRTRVHRPTMLLLPRYVTVTAASLATLALGTLGAWYETTVLLGSVPFGPLVVGLGLEAIWLCFVTSVVAAWTSAIRGVLGVVGCSIGLLLALALLGNLPAASSWVPTRLAASAADPLRHDVRDVWHAVVLSVVATVAGVGVAVQRLGAREGSAGSPGDRRRG
jgi:ABC-2 type transport system permease protein